MFSRIPVFRAKACADQPLLRSKMPELDALRGFACLFVLLYHGLAHDYIPEHMNLAERSLVWLLRYGWTGVNLFFVLSGFLIAGILLDTRARPGYYRRFYVRRALRVLPAYYGILLLVALVWKFGLSDRPYSWFFFGMSSVYLANVTPLFGVPIQFPVLWSLAVEEHYYLIWPTIVRKLKTGALALSAGMICLFALIFRFVAFRMGANVFGYYTWLVCDGLAMGSLLAIVARRYRSDRRTLWKIAACAGAYATICFVIEKTPAIYFTGAALQVSCINAFYSSALLVFLLLGSKFGIRSRLLEFVGEISYGVYLIHMLVFEVFDAMARRHFPLLAPGHLNFSLSCVRFAIVAAATMIFAFISRWYFEEPFLRLKDRLASDPEPIGEEPQPELAEVAA